MNRNAKERRKHCRHSVSYPIEVALLDFDKSRKTEQLHSISDGGISFTTDEGERYRIDQQISVSIKGKTEEAPSLTASATIIWIDYSPFKLNAATVGICFKELIEHHKIFD